MPIEVGLGARRNSCGCPPCSNTPPANICDYLGSLGDPFHVRLTSCAGTFEFDSTRETPDPGPGFGNCRFNGSGAGPGDLSADIQWGYDAGAGFWYAGHISESNAGTCSAGYPTTPDLVLIYANGPSTYISPSAAVWSPFSLTWNTNGFYVFNYAGPPCSGSDIMACHTPAATGTSSAWIVTPSSAMTVEIWK